MSRRNKQVWVAVLTFCLVGAGLPLGQAQQPQTEQKQGPIQPRPEQEKETPYALRVEVPVVNLDVTVVDRDGNFISGLRKEHFRVYVDGQEQEISAFAPSEAPLTTVLLVENTRLVGYIMYENVDAAYLFLRQLRKDDWAALVAYDLQPRIEVDFTQDRQQIVNTLRQIQFGIGSFSEANMYDAVIDTLDRLKDVEGKKSIVLIGTGLDTFSRHTWDDVRKAVREHRTTIFPIGMSWQLTLRLDRAEIYGSRGTGPARLQVLMGEAQLRDIAEQSGGRAFFPRFITQLPNIYEQVGAMLRNQYSLAFQPKNFKRDGKFHKVSVKLVGPNGQPLKVVNQHGKEVKYEIHARQGYYAPQG